MIAVPPSSHGPSVEGSVDAATALVALANLADALAYVEEVSRRCGFPESVEFIESLGVELVADAIGTHPPLAGTALLLLEWPVQAAGTDELTRWLGASSLARGVLVARDKTGRDELWAWRQLVEAGSLPLRRITRSIADVAPENVAGLVTRARGDLASRVPEALLVAFGDLRVATVWLDILDGPRGGFDEDARDWLDRQVGMHCRSLRRAVPPQ